MSAAEHEARNAEQVRMLWAEVDRAGAVGSGYTPSAWCPNCHAPYRAELPTCPECPTEPLAPGPALIVRLLTSDLRAMRSDHVAAVLGLDLDAASTLMEELEAAGHVALGLDGRWVLA